ncbi:MAG: phytoene/squalene synthase family protein [Planctomycetota bacterium]
MNLPLENSYRSCAALVRRAASSFYWSLWCLPEQKRRGLHALYAFCRHTDDLGDSPLPATDRQAALYVWRQQLVTHLQTAEVASQAVLPHSADDATGLLPALVDTVVRHQIPIRYLFEVIDGVESDITPRVIQNFDELREYCRLVASSVGLACLHVWGFEGEGVLAKATECGVAFQLTNIIRDIPEDAARGRIYLPQEDLDRFGYSDADLRAGVWNDAGRALVKFQLERAAHSFAIGRQTRNYLAADAVDSFDVMFNTYQRLWRAIEKCDGEVFRRRVRLSWWDKVAITTQWSWQRWRRRWLPSAASRRARLQTP